MFPIIILSIEDDGDRDFMLSIYEQYKKLIYSEVLKLISRPVDVEDTVQDVLEKLIKNLQLIRSLKENQRTAYIIVVARHQAIDLLRLKNKEKLPFASEDGTIPEPEDENADIETNFIRAFNISEFNRLWPQLDEGTRYLLESKYILKETDEELAKRLGVKPASIRMTLTRAKRKAMKLLVDVYVNS